MIELKRPTNRWEWIEIAVLVAAAAVALLVSILDFVGVLGEESWLKERIGTLTLLSIAIVASYLVIERRRFLAESAKQTQEKLEQLERTVESEILTLINSVSGVQIRKFDNNTQLMKYVVGRLKNVKKSVDDLTWSHRISLSYELPAQQKVEAVYQDRITELSRRLQYREIFIFNKQSRIDKLKRRLEENSEGYSCGYYKDSETPPLQFMLIDGEEVVFASAVFPVKCTVRGPEIGEIFAAYFEEAWRSAIPLKLGTKIYREEVESVIQGFKETEAKD